MSFPELRASIPATRDTIYMNTGFTGPSPEPVIRRMREVLERESSVGPASVEGLAQSRRIAEEAREAVAELLNADPDEVAITHGTTEGLHVVIYGLDWRPGDEFVTCTLEHPALATPAGVLEERYGVTVKRVEIPPNAAPSLALEMIASALTPRTKLVALSHVQFSCGLKLPAKQIVDAAHRAGTLIALDGAQTGGQLALDVHALGVDFYSISGQKWCLGPQGTGALYVRRDHHRLLAPLFTTHAMADSRAIPGEGPGGGNPLARFRIASQSPALTAGFAEAVRLLTSLGVGEIEAYTHGLGARLRSGLSSIPGCTVTGPLAAEASCGLTAVAVEGWEPRDLVDALWERYRIAVRAVANPAAIRFSTGAFNTEEEVDRVLEAMRALAASGPGVFDSGTKS
ncbi:MAG TPA: aminotransferase class V-fold PLP-dependent enzyme [Dehalococcoidia bacterium]|nr:aminotransferase class V-fold PLP-dependent enzyme [Dehalococcoidia bacterium]